MGRWRPPTKPSSPYITKEGAEMLRVQLDDLWTNVRPECLAALTAAAAEGDRSENAEYIYRKKQLAQIDGKLRFLSKRLEVVEIVDSAPRETSKIFFGAWLRLEDEEGEESVYRIVGPDETDAKRGFISMDSPLAKAFMGKAVDDEVLVQTPSGSKELVVIEVSYTEIA